jgi:sulfotransferase
LFDDFHADCTAEVIVDTNRRWPGPMPATARLFLDARVIACQRIAVGDRQIERLVQRN